MADRPAGARRGIRSVTMRQFWRVQLAFWALYALVHYAATLPAIPPDERWHMAGIKVIRAASGLLVSSLLPLVYRRLLSARRPPLAVIAVSTVVVLVLGNVWLTVDRILLTLVRSVTPLQVNWDRFPRGFDLDYAFVLLAWIGGYVALWHWRDAARRREEALEQAMLARDAKLQALGYQLNPHFLFNTLNALRGVIAEDQGRAREMVTRLAAFLRYSLTAPPETTVADEIEMTHAYLAIERARFEETLEASVNADEASQRCIVPSLVLQPLVENALRHGHADGAGVRRVRVAVHVDGHRLMLEVLNTGSLGPGAETGIGISNTRARLAYAYPDRATLRVSQDGAWTRAIVDIEEPRHAAARVNR